MCGQLWEWAEQTWVCLYITSIPEDGREKIRRNTMSASLASTSHLNSLLSSCPLQDQKDAISDLSSY